MNVSPNEMQSDSSCGAIHKDCVGARMQSQTESALKPFHNNKHDNHAWL